MYPRKEIDEAIWAGQSALAKLQEAQNALTAARSFGAWDIMGGGFVSSLMKHNKISQAQKSLNEAQYALQAFNKELADINIYLNTSIGFNGVTKFFDIWCDNIFTDIAVQSQIRTTQRNLEQLMRHVSNILVQLDHMRY